MASFQKRCIDQRQWLHIGKQTYLGVVYSRRAFNPNAPGLASLQWDSAELTSIYVHDQMSYDDAFTIEKVFILIVVRNMHTPFSKLGR